MKSIDALGKCWWGGGCGRNGRNTPVQSTFPCPCSWRSLVLE
jgi:hypothetical protein